MPFIRRLRLVHWFWKRLAIRYWRALVSSFLVGLLLVLLSIRLYPAISSIAIRQEKIIGMVGIYTPTTLPIPLQNLLSAGLVGITITGEPSPALATSWEVYDDGKRYVFHLKENIVWHDKKPFVASDVNYNLRDVTIKTIDDRTLETTLTEPFSAFPILLAKPLFRKGLVGVGAYKISSIRLKGDKVTYLRLVPFQKSDQLQPVTIKFYPTEEAAQLGFILGEVNMLDEMINPEPFLTWPHVSIKQSVKFNQYVGLFFNMNDKLMSEKSIRQALAYALEKSEENTVLTPLSSQSWAYNNKVKQYDIDLTASKKQLAKVFEATESAEIVLSTFHEYLPLANQIASSWEKLEQIKVKIKVESGLPDNFQILLTSQEIPPDPDQYPFWHSTQDQTNITNYANPKIDKLLEDGRKEHDLQKRQVIYYEFQRNLVEDLPAIFMFHPTLYTISRE